ncbi:carboxymuconolactone decarboxylase [Xylogone sp. PMI_703]|nr:carboxymuconolactone decarboxylase [Xylogone sp. PMI_703]
MSLDAKQLELKQKFVDGRGIWTEEWEHFLRLNPIFFEKYLNWMLVPVEKRHLPAKIQEFVHITVNAAVTHIHPSWIRAHIQAALAVGATKDEVLEVLELSSTVSIHACNIGIPTLLEVMKEEGLYQPKPLSDYQQRLKSQFTESRGYWHAFWEEFLELDPQFFDGYTALSSSPWKSGSLEPKYKELMYCAFDCACTHLYRPGLKVHMQNAIRLGATPEQVMEVLEIASLIGIQAVTTSMPILADELKKPRA